MEYSCSEDEKKPHTVTVSMFLWVLTSRLFRAVTISGHQLCHLSQTSVYPL
jgi:hypothetical protein